MIEELYNDYYKYADFYDIFNKYRNYERETRFLLNMLKNKKRILDLGCGTGTHLNILENLGYIVEGIDLSEKMVLLAKEKVKGPIHKANILDYKIDEKYDGIIAMHFVFNHLKGYDEFEKALQNSLDHLNSKGIMIIDLDNRRVSGDVYDKVDGNKRHLECFYSDNYSIQIRTSFFTIGLKEFIFEHEYFIYEKEKLEEILDKYDITYVMLTNFLKMRANKNSERIHIVIKKN
ncbi:MAG: class I SAM-dependent methyltransferase [Bacilli bacterium]|nr:class I SAM-dependent methyltransferase [Bacilli bacterium]